MWVSSAAWRENSVFLKWLVGSKFVSVSWVFPNLASYLRSPRRRRCFRIASHLFFPFFMDLFGCLLLSLLTFGMFLPALLGGAAVGLANTGSVGVGQQTTPSISTTSQIDPSSIERAYAALGLTYQGNQMQTQAQAQVKNQQQGQQPQGLRPMNPISK